MTEALDLLLNRRSIRSFSTRQVSDEVIQQILQAGLHAATAMNRQSWHITVVQNQQFLNQINAAVAAVLVESEVPSLVERGSSSDFSVFHHAPTVCFVSSDGSDYSLADCANACQNMCLAAAALGLGSCYIGSFVQAFDHTSGDQIIQRFSLPEGYLPVFAVAIGHMGEGSPLFEKDRAWKVSYIR